MFISDCSLSVKSLYIFVRLSFHPCSHFWLSLFLMTLHFTHNKSLALFEILLFQLISDYFYNIEGFWGNLELFKVLIKDGDNFLL